MVYAGAAPTSTCTNSPAACSVQLISTPEQLADRCCERAHYLHGPRQAYREESAHASRPEIAVAERPRHDSHGPHTRVLAAFHRYAVDAQPKTKQGLVNGLCVAL